MGAGADVDGFQGTVLVPGFRLGHPSGLEIHGGDRSQSRPPVFPLRPLHVRRWGVMFTAAVAEHQGAASVPCPLGWGSTREGLRAERETGNL